MFRVALPGRLVTLIASLAAYLKGAADQAGRDQKASADANAKATQTVEMERAKAEAEDHDALVKDTDTWSR